MCVQGMSLQQMRADAKCKSVRGSVGVHTHAFHLVSVILCILIKLILDIMKLLLMLGHV